MQQMSFIQSEHEDTYRPQVNDLPVRDRPVNRLREAGPGALSTTEVVACLIQTLDALNQAQQLLARFDGIPGLVHASGTELAEVDGIGPSNVSPIKAALEFGRRLNLAAKEDRLKVRSPTDLSAILLPEMSHLEREHFVVVSLDTRHQALGKQTLYIGCINATHIRVAEVFQEPIRRSAADKGTLVKVHPDVDSACSSNSPGHRPGRVSARTFARLGFGGYGSPPPPRCPRGPWS